MWRHFHGFSRYFHNYKRKFQGFPGSFMVVQGISMVFRVFSLLGTPPNVPAWLYPCPTIPPARPCGPIMMMTMRRRMMTMMLMMAMMMMMMIEPGQQASRNRGWSECSGVDPFLSGLPPPKDDDNDDYGDDSDDLRFSSAPEEGTREVMTMLMTRMMMTMVVMTIVILVMVVLWQGWWSWQWVPRPLLPHDWWTELRKPPTNIA